MDDECGADGVEPEEHDKEKASAHSYRRYVGCIVGELMPTMGQQEVAIAIAIISETWVLD